MSVLSEELKWKHRLEDFFLSSKLSYKNMTQKKTLNRIAVILPIFYGFGGSFKGLKSTAKMIKMGSLAEGKELDVIVCVPAGFYNLRRDFTDLYSLNIRVRELNWRTISSFELSNAMRLGRYDQVELEFDEYLLPDDGINFLMDCDFWFMISDRTSRPLVPIKPYGMLIYDYIQRYFPKAFYADFDDTCFLQSTRHASFAAYTTPFAADSAINYAGVDPERVHLVPLETHLNPDHPVGKPYLSGKDYFVWSTNATPHKNHIAALNALDEYYSAYQGKLPVVVTGLFTDWFDLKQPDRIEHQGPYIAKVREVIAPSKSLRKNVIFAGELSEADYLATLKSAKFLWHPTLVDNGTFCVVEAAYHGTPCLSHDYPPMRFYDQRFALNISFFNARNPRNGAEALKDMEDNLEQRCKALPSPYFLEQLSWKYIAPEFWAQLRPLIEESL